MAVDRVDAWNCLWALRGKLLFLSPRDGRIPVVTLDTPASMGRPNAPRVEAVAARILNDCLIQDGSLLTPGIAIWTTELLAELHTHYVAAPDVSAKSFGDKLEIQLVGVSDHARQLFAELYVLNLLSAAKRNFLQKTKIAYVERVLAPIRPPVTLPADVVDGFSDGVFNGGRAWMNRGWAQLSFLVEFAEHFKQQDQATRVAARTDPVQLRHLVMDSPGHNEPAQRHALLYLFQPRFFLPIVSEDHRRLLREGLGGTYLPDGPTDDLDADLHTIMEALEREAGGPVDVYDDTWRPRWLEETVNPPPPPQSRQGPAGKQPPGSSEPRLYSVADIVKAGSFHSARRLQQILNHWRDKQNLVLQDAPAPFLPIMKTDIVLDNASSGRRVVIETKFTDGLIDRDGRTTVKSGYLYQLYSYLASQSGRGDPAHDNAEGVLLFVKTDGRDVFDAETTVQKHRIRFLSVDLSQRPAQIRARWMQCLDQPRPVPG